MLRVSFGVPSVRNVILIIQLIQTFESKRVFLMSVWTWANWNCPRHIITLTCIYFLKGMDLKTKEICNSFWVIQFQWVCDEIKSTKSFGASAVC